MALVQKSSSLISERMAEIDLVDGRIADLNNELRALKAQRRQLADIRVDVQFVAQIVGEFVQDHELGLILAKLLDHSRPSMEPRNRP